MKVFLCGFMGAGKTSLLKKLGGDPLAYLDLDEEILKNSDFDNLGNLIQDIGWKGFRDLELLKIKEILLLKADLVVALGGGAFNQESQKLIFKDKNNFTIWLNTPFEVCLERILASGDRPLAKKDHDYLLNLYNDRLNDYKKCDVYLNQKEQESVKNIKDLISLMPAK